MKPLQEIPFAPQAVIAGTTAGVILLAIASMMGGEFSILPYFLIIPMLLVILYYPRYGVFFTVFIGGIFLSLLYFFSAGRLLIIAGGTAWFFILVSIGIVITSYATGKLHEEQRYRTVFTHSPAGLFVLDSTLTRVLDANPRCSLLLGFERDELLRMDPGSIWAGPEYHNQFIAEIRKCGRVEDLEVQLRNRHGLPVWILLSAVPSGNGALICSAVDLTGPKEAEETLRTFNAALEEGVRKRTAELAEALREREILLQEVQHRVRNNLQVIISLISTQVRNTEDAKAKEALGDCRARVRAISLAHLSLYRSAGGTRIGLDGYLRQVVLQAYQDLGTDTRRIVPVIDAGSVQIGIDMAIVTGLIVNELVNNSLRYAFPDGRAGTITLAGSREGSEIILVIHDDGIGMPTEIPDEEPETTGMMIVRLLARQMRGSVSRLDGPGTGFRIVLEEKPGDSMAGSGEAA